MINQSDHSRETGEHVPSNVAVATAVASARVLTEWGDFSAPQRVSWAGGRFALGGDSLAGGDSEPGGSTSRTQSTADLAAPNGGDLWMVPGLVDAHSHIASHYFNVADRALDAPSERNAKTLAVLQLMLRNGFTSVRDAAGFEFTHLPAQVPEIPRIQASVHMLSRELADESGGVLAVAERSLEAGARWIKLLATASVASPPGSGLEPIFTLDEQRQVVERAAEVGAGVMLHAWGGQAIDDAIEAGVMSIEHGIFLTDDQARRAADRGMTHVPTLTIYRFVQQMIEKGELPAEFGPRVAEAVLAHPDSVRRSRDAGLAIALGSDFGTPEQHGTNRVEFDALVGAGLSPEEALVAATRAGAELLGRVDPDPHGASSAPSGRIETGEIADAVFFTQDPREPGVFSAPDSVYAVVIGGRVVLDPHPRKDTP
ncbi:amidohydrolase family protein [Leucobacter denitrificans]|uniref:amidohydrolase family protein n=1 Tax=Leucobacter denitrificans TaxID=683042 RepID=UPI00361D245A